MKNSVLSFNPKTPDNVHKYRKENHFFAELALIDLDSGFSGLEPAAVTVRFYATSAVTYCCVWLRHNRTAARGAGKASGYGYHRPSAAMHSALEAAGFKLEHAIDGVGDSAMEGALLAIAERLKIFRPYIHRAHA